MVTPPTPAGDTLPIPPALAVPPSIDFIWEMGLRKIRDQIQVFEALDSKVGVILGFVVVSIVEILGFLILAAAEATTPVQLQHSQAFTCGVTVIFVFGLVLSISSTYLGLLALRIQNFAIGFDYGKMVERANLTEHELKATFVDDLMQSINENERELADKVTFAKRSGMCVLGGLVCYTLVEVMLFWAFVPGR